MDQLGLALPTRSGLRLLTARAMLARFGPTRERAPAVMYEGVRGALESDDQLSTLGEQPRFRVRETPDWKQHAADLEAEMIGRGMIFEVIDWG